MQNERGEAYTENAAGRRGDVPPLSDSASLMETMQLATVLTSRKPIQRSRVGEAPEGLPGSESVACCKRGVRNLGEPPASSNEEVGPVNRKKTVRRAGRQSDHPIVL